MGSASTVIPGQKNRTYFYRLVHCDNVNIDAIYIKLPHH